MRVCSQGSARNAGGKTASLKTLGLLVLMAKAGLFLPLEPRPQGGSPELEWFSEVLADVGDSQDLTQSISTYSGHLRRLKRITAAVRPSSLVLLDEVSLHCASLWGPCNVDGASRCPSSTHSAQHTISPSETIRNTLKRRWPAYLTPKGRERQVALHLASCVMLQGYLSCRRLESSGLG